MYLDFWRRSLYFYSEVMFLEIVRIQLDLIRSQFVVLLITRKHITMYHQVVKHLLHCSSLIGTKTFQNLFEFTWLYVTILCLLFFLVNVWVLIENIKALEFYFVGIYLEGNGVKQASNSLQELSILLHLD